MSFSSQTKEELCQAMKQANQDEKIVFCAFVRTAGLLRLQSGAQKTISVLTDNKTVARWSISKAKKYYALQTDIRVVYQMKLKKKQSLDILLSGGDIEKLFIDIGILSKDNKRFVLDGIVSDENLTHESEKISFLSGSFLGCASISNPKRSYHLEFVLQDESMAQLIESLLNFFQLNAKRVLRKEMHVVYLKESEKIAEFLKRISTYSALLQFEDARAYKEFRNDLNRKVNCETANIQKTITASTRQIDNIQALISNQGLQDLSPALQETARLRVQYPDATLVELGEMLSTPIGKSGVNHRLCKLEKLAKKFCE